MSQIQIRPISTEDVEGFHSCLDAVARERKYVGLLEAPPLENLRKWLETGINHGDIRLVALSGSHMIGWCDIESQKREGFRHAGRLGWVFSKIFVGEDSGINCSRQP